MTRFGKALLTTALAAAIIPASAATSSSSTTAALHRGSHAGGHWRCRQLGLSRLDCYVKIRGHDRWVTANRKRFHFSSSLVAFHRRELEHAQAHINRIMARRHRAAGASLGGIPSGVLHGFLCIHGYEGAWDDPDPPYFGGLQMDMDFQQAWGPEYLARYGTADHWPVSVQIAVAYRAYRSGLGWSPWPNTAHYCGLR